MKVLFEFTVEDNKDFMLLLLNIAEFFPQLNKIILNCFCGASTESGKHLTTSPEDQSDKDYDFIKRHTNCKGVQTCQTKKVIN